MISSEAPGSGRCWEPRLAPRAQYRIEAVADPLRHHIKGRQTVAFRNNSAAPARLFCFDWVRSANSSLVLESPNGRLRDDLPGNRLALELEEPVGREELVTLSMRFDGEMKERDWHPRLWWGQEALAFDDYSVRVDVPSHYSVATSGRWNLVEEAYEATGVPCFGLLLSEQLDVVETEIQGVLIQAAFKKNGEACARHCLQAAADAIEYYIDWVGFYPSTSLWIAPGIDQPWGGGPFAPGIVLLYGMETFADSPADYWTYLTAHEIGHQYWGEYILTNYMPWPDTAFFREFVRTMNNAGFESGRGLLEWLHLGMSIYMDRRFARSRGLKVGSPRQRMAHYLQGIAEGIDTTLEGRPYRKDIDYNNIIAHSKGFSAISAFAQVIGHDAFERVLVRCLRKYGGRRVTLEILQQVCEEEAGLDLGWLFDSWVTTNEILDYQVVSSSSRHVNGEWLTAITVARIGSMRMPVPVRVAFEDGTTQTQLTDRNLDRTLLEFRSAAPVARVELDPHEELAMLDSCL
ncbi:hypothetical protein ACFLSZ_06835 [Candidatus Bipolaricaulota bacterium]